MEVWNNYGQHLIGDTKKTFVFLEKFTGSEAMGVLVPEMEVLLLDASSMHEKILELRQIISWLRLKNLKKPVSAKLWIRAGEVSEIQKEVVTINGTVNAKGHGFMGIVCLVNNDAKLWKQAAELSKAAANNSLDMTFIADLLKNVSAAM